jgi:hypothetical protein
MAWLRLLFRLYIFTDYVFLYHDRKKKRCVKELGPTLTNKKANGRGSISGTGRAKALTMGKGWQHELTESDKSLEGSGLI